MLRDFPILELQADELFTFVGSKRRTIWLFAIIEVSSRLWAGSRLGRRSYRQAKAVLNDVVLNGRLVGVPLITTDGFEYYFGAILEKPIAPSPEGMGSTVSARSKRDAKTSFANTLSSSAATTPSSDRAAR
jgi:hypothetical protein